MASTHTSLNVHAVFSTKERRPLIKDNWKEDLFAYIGGIAKNLNVVPYAIGGIEDHVHALLGLRTTHRVDYLLRELKADSSGWLRREKKAAFAWQAGYAAFSVSPDRIENVKRYIFRQEEHHKKVSFKEEYVTLLNESGMQYDPDFLW